MLHHSFVDNGHSNQSVLGVGILYKLTRKQNDRQRVIPGMMLLLILGLILAGCGNGEPEVVATAIPEPTLIPDVGYPQQSPDIARGAAIFAENCTDCHGEFAQGNGPLVLNGQVSVNIADFNDEASTFGQSPIEWFETISVGNLETLMPPWKLSMSEEFRWDVALYTFTLNYQPESVTQGQEIWQETCAECHGIDGTGVDGVGDLTDQAAMVLLSDAALVETLTADIGDVAHDFSEVLDENQRLNSVQYLRVLGLANVDKLVEPVDVADVAPTALPDGPVSTPETTPGVGDGDTIAAADEVMGTVTGRILNGTAGSEVLPNMSVVLTIQDNVGGQETLETLADANGEFIFEDVPILADQFYQTSVFYQEGFFNSDVLPGDPNNPSLDFTVTLYELTDDPTVIISQGVFVQAAPMGTELQVAQLVYFVNISDKIYWPELEEMNGHRGSVKIQVPANAFQIQMMSAPENYILSEDDSSVTYLQPIFPGEELDIRILYLLPNDEEVKVELPVDYITDGWLTIFTPESMSAIGDGIIDLGPQAGEQGVFNAFEEPLALSTGDTIVFEIVTGGGGGFGESSNISRNTLISILLVAGGLLMILGAGFLFWSERKSQKISDEDAKLLVAGLVKQIAELDQMHESGEITEDNYQTQRGKLKARLTKYMKKKK
jgi:mono/diheme cytochrome c family protein